MQKNKKYNVLDLFCGCGGLSKGFEMAGYNIVSLVVKPALNGLQEQKNARPTNL